MRWSPILGGGAAFVSLLCLMWFLWGDMFVLKTRGCCVGLWFTREGREEGRLREIGLEHGRWGCVQATEMPLLRVKKKKKVLLLWPVAGLKILPSS